MAEQTESVRGDKGTREVKGQEVNDWSGRRVVLPTGTSLPAITNDLRDGEVFVKTPGSGTNPQMYVFDEDINNWVTVGPG